MKRNIILAAFSISLFAVCTIATLALGDILSQYLYILL